MLAPTRERTRDPTEAMSRRWPLFAIFVLSGAAGLIYEVVWGRQLVLVFGNTTQAVATILTGFFGGMAIGSVLGGRIADHVRRPLRMYGLLELCLAGLVLLTPITFRLLHDVYRGVFDALVANPQLLALVRFGLSLLTLAPATILLGATLPTLTRHLSRNSSGLSSAFGRLYAANTFGAILGAMAAGFVLIELLGLTGALVVGAISSAIAGIVGILLDLTQKPAAVAGAAPDAPGAPDVTGATEQEASAALAIGTVPRPRVRLALIVAFVSGLTSLGYEVLWTRLLSTGTGGSTYVFTTILTIFLIGLALGAAVFNVVRTRIPPINLLALGQIGTALFILLGMVVLAHNGIPQGLDLYTRFGSLFRYFALPVLVTLLPATFMMGLTFPATSALVADPNGGVGSSAGLLLSANTIGAITGTFLVPFAVIPLVGSPVAVGLLVLVNAGMGIVLAFAGPIEAPVLRAFTPGAGMVPAVALVFALVSGQIFVDPTVAWLHAHNGSIDGSAEDEIASVQAGSIGGGQLQLWVGGTAMTVLTEDTKLMPILPLMLRPHAATDLTIAFGMGSAYRTALIAGLKVEAVELVPSVPKMFSVFYPDARQVMANPNGHVTIADGRNFVELTTHRYDIIVVDPPPPIYTSGVSVISSREFYAAAKARLNPGGVMMQWLPYGQSIDEFKAHLRTYRNVFPHVILAFAPANHGVFMLGSDQPIAFDSSAIRQVLRRPGVVQDLSSAFDSSAHTLDGWASLIPTLVWLQGDQVASFAGGGPLVTDDHPLPEYFLLRHQFGPQSPWVTQQRLQALAPASHAHGASLRAPPGSSRDALMTTTERRW